MHAPSPIAGITTLALRLTPRGQLLAQSDAEAPALEQELADRLLHAFAQGTGHGLLQLGAAEIGRGLPPDWSWWRDFAARYVTALCASPEGGTIAVEPPTADFLQHRIADAPPMTGSEYLTNALLSALWVTLDSALREELALARVPLQEFLQKRHPAWNLVGRVHFNLAENRKDPEAPFAFLATYTMRLSAHGKAQHQPLAQALAEFAGSKSQARLLSLLLPVQRAATQCEWLREMVDQGEIYHPMRWTATEVSRFLADLPRLEAAGIVVRMPGTWRSGRPARVLVQASVGERPPSLLGLDAMLDFKVAVCLEGEGLSASEVQALLDGSEGLQFIRGRWVEVDKNALSRLLERFRGMEQAAAGEGGLSMAQGMRLLAGASLEDAVTASDASWSDLVAGPWLTETLQGLRQPQGLAQVNPGSALKAQLRPYQQAGVRWLYLLTRLQLGACLADDMGLGKTIQILALLLLLKRESRDRPSGPSLLVAPASLLANWAAEAARFAPDLRLLVAHASAMPTAEFQALDAGRLQQFDLVVTSYGALLRPGALAQVHWHLVVADEAQAIKNPGAKQTRQLKKLQAQSRIALTGTPVENRLSDLWSIFDFTHPGLLGSDKVFAKFTKRLASNGHFGPLRNLVQPYILRRMKTDKQVIADLPDKTEIKTWCHLSPTQAALYQRAVQDLASALEDAEGIGRKGVVLSFLMRFKQICNHPSQWLGDGAWDADASGKFARLRELVEVIAARQEKLLVFTQFRETIEPLTAFLGSIFGRDGLALHGGTPVARRRDLVQQFQDDELVPFFVLSLKAGGSGLNLTAASHVIHFDRWWNPAVENQATDRAFRIGQQRKVMVHKFICRGTVEERIDRLIESKRQLVSDLLEGGAELLLTEMSDRELLDLVKLDIRSVQEN